VLGLEYLYRAWDLRDHGLTVNLRGYQHMALLQWRELRSTAAHPWDRLCDALHGSGVYSLDEALSKLQVQPLLEALRGAVNGQTIETFAKLAKKPETLVAKVVTEEIPAKAKPAKKKKPEAVVPAAEPLADTEPAEVDAERKTFLASAHLFKERVLEYVSTNGVVLHGHRGTKDRAELIPDADAKVPEEATGQPVDPFAALVASSLNLLSADAALSEAIHAPTTTSARTALTGTQMWAPVLAWLVFQDAASEVSPVEIFDALNLRWALAETFSSVGFEGESAWKAAAQIGVLLRFAATEDLTRTLQSEVFWRDPDVRWLAGVNNAAGKEYINQERFEELLRWMAVPSLIETDALSAKDLVPGLVAATKTLKQANFEYDRFLEAMCLPSLQEKPVTP
jgi:hypothetical protein